MNTKEGDCDDRYLSGETS